MKVTQQCINDAFNIFVRDYSVQDDVECCIAVIGSSFPKALHVEKGATFQRFLEIYRMFIAKQGAYQLIVWDNQTTETVRLTYIQKFQFKTVIVNKDTRKFHHVIEDLHPFTQFLCKNSRCLIRTEMHFLRQQELGRSRKQTTIDPLAVNTPIFTSKSKIAKIIRFVQRDAQDQDTVAGVPFYKEVIKPEFFTTVATWMTDILFVREPLENDSFKLTIFNKTSQRSYSFKKGSYAFKEVPLSDSTLVERLINTKPQYLRSRADAFTYKDVLYKKRVISQSLRII